ncbi:MAG: UDP-N-acetylmuramoyl-L-alanyl-D-glutamate--2,6-diaminopimelate ligase, partial [Betaproteobacteria bacterium]
MIAAVTTAPDAETAALLSKLAVPITRITSDSRHVRPGDTFAAYRGSHQDGRRFIADAIGRGAGAILWDAEGFSWNREWKLPHLPVDNLKSRLGSIADVVYGHPSRELWVVGVTGTNGKTSCAHWIAAGLDVAGRRAAVIGTLGNGLWGSLAPATHTTP